MTETDGDIFFDELKERYGFLEYLPLENVFSLFSVKKYSGPYTEDICRNLPTGNNGNCDLHSLCLSFHTIIPLLESPLNPEDLHTKINWCDYLNFWIYNYIKNSKSCNETQQFYEKIKILMSKYHPQYDCNIEYPTIEHDKLIKKIKISLYTEILFWIEKAYDIIMDIDDLMIYDKYLGECFKFYQKIKCPDNPETKEDYSDEWTKFESNFNSSISFLKEKGVKLSNEGITLPNMSICKLAWENVQESVELQAGAQGTITEDRGSVNTRKKEQESPGEEVPQGGESVKGEVLPSEPKLSAGTGALASIDLNDTGNDGESSESVMPKKVGTIGATLAGSSLFLIMMYKYTPLGSWVSTRILGRNKLMENMRKNNYELLLNDVGDRETKENKIIKKFFK